MTTPLDIGARLAPERRSQGISQRELGEALGVRQQQIARWETTGYRTASLQRVDSAARALGLELEAPVGAHATLLAAESVAAYGATATANVAPVRDLGEIAARIRANGDVLRDRYHLDRIGVFGSFVYGEQTPVSDVDLLVEFARKPRGFAYFEPIVFAEELLGREVDFVEPALLRERLRDRVLKDTVYVWST